ncbi:MAG: hypothetical protein OEY03_12095 [Rhizobacter sp.]|nr:hypothetical protein [Rhizobacter sp.]
MPHHLRRKHQSGTTLLEALVALLVLALGMLSFGRVQTQLRLNAELARQRVEAVRLAQEDMERLRAFSALTLTTGARSYAEIADASTVIDADSGYASNTRYALTRSVTHADAPNAKTASVGVSWVDRAGAAHQVALNSVISGIHPAHTGALAVAIGRQRGQNIRARSPAVPLAAKDLGNGTSVFKPVSHGSLAFVLSNLDGAVAGRCGVNTALRTQDLTLADLASCSTVNGQLLSGHIRFSSALPPDAAAAHDAPLAVAIALTAIGDGHPRAPDCSSEALKIVSYLRAGATRSEAVPIDAGPAYLGLSSWTETGDRHVAYHCVVYPAAGTAAWSGRTDLVPNGWRIGIGPDDRRVCRFSADLDGSGTIDANIEHPARYDNVNGALPNQNFLVVMGSQACPTGSPLRLDGAGSDVFVNLATVPHQP